MEIEGRLLFWIWFTRKYFMFHLLQVPRIPWFDLMCHQKNITWKKQNEHWLLRGKVFIAYPIPNTFARKFCTLKVKSIACYTNKLLQKVCMIGKTITKKLATWFWILYILTAFYFTINVSYPWSNLPMEVINPKLVLSSSPSECCDHILGHHRFETIQWQLETAF